MHSCLFLMHHLFGKKKKHLDPEELLKTAPKRPSLRVSAKLSDDKETIEVGSNKNVHKKEKHTKIRPFTKNRTQKQRLSSPPPLTPPPSVSVAELSKLGLRVSQQVLGRPIKSEEEQLSFETASKGSRTSKTAPSPPKTASSPPKTASSNPTKTASISPPKTTTASPKKSTSKSLSPRKSSEKKSLILAVDSMEIVTAKKEQPEKSDGKNE